MSDAAVDGAVGRPSDDAERLARDGAVIVVASSRSVMITTLFGSAPLSPEVLDVDVVAQRVTVFAVYDAGQVAQTDRSSRRATCAIARRSELLSTVPTRPLVNT